MGKKHLSERNLGFETLQLHVGQEEAGKIGHHNVDPRAPEPQRNAGGNVSGAFYHYEHSLFPLEMVLNPV